ncbi:hypothetical protein FEM48_ZijujMtG0003400 (mitochondrion) [Ziziphus jujuba var. spinosa]|uniref:Uncharacterized protein n=1 Tax=Ziziphus jujuba var. spinosa TaxID=714518 RepID=A0A978UA79_ZIZJJ|nr:hypothetical protein FEM48_ZijujMtG0003400 [Ziziphus jujuba var. spinosa]
MMIPKKEFRAPKRNGFRDFLLTEDPSARFLPPSSLWIELSLFSIVSTFGIGLAGPTKLVSRPNVARVCVEIGLLKENLPNHDKVMPVTNAKSRIRNLVSTHVAAADMQTIEEGPRGKELEPDNNPQAPVLQQPEYLAINRLRPPTDHALDPSGPDSNEPMETPFFFVAIQRQVRAFSLEGRSSKPLHSNDHDEESNSSSQDPQSSIFEKDLKPEPPNRTRQTNGSTWASLLRLPPQPLQTLSENAPVVVAVGRAFVLIAPGSDLYDLRAGGAEPSYLSMERSSGLRAWEQLKQRRVWSGLNSGPARPSAARSGNGARRGRRYAPLLRCGRHRSHETRPLLALEPWAGRPGLSLLFCSRHEKDAQKSGAGPISRTCPLLLPPGGALVILTVLSAGVPSHCSSHKLWQLQLATTGARPAGPEWAQRSVQRTVAPPTRKGINMETSLPFGSENLWRKSGFKFPETTRLYSQREYAPPKIIPSAANVATKLFLWKAPTEMGNSPIKLLVPGELILAKVEEKEMVGRFGMVLTEPPEPEIVHRYSSMQRGRDDVTYYDHVQKCCPSARQYGTSQQLPSLGRKRRAPAPHWDFAFLIYVRTASALAKKRSALLKKKGRVLVGPLCSKCLLDSHPRFPRGGRAVFPQRPASGGRKRTQVGSARFAFSCVESFSFSYRSPRPRRGRVKPSEAAGSTERWGDEGDSAHGLDHTTG